MRKDELMLLLEEGISVEEVTTFTNLDEVEDLIEKANFDPETIKKLKKGLSHLKKETALHSKWFSDMLRSVIKSQKNEY